MRRLTFDQLTALAVEALPSCQDADELAACETQALVEAFEGGDGEGAAVPGGTGTVDRYHAARALEDFARDLLRIAGALRGGGFDASRIQERG